MFSIGNHFGRRVAPPVEKSQVESQATLQGAQEALERASEACQAKADELADATTHLAELEQEAGRQDADGEDHTTTTAAVQATAATVTRLTHALSILEQRREQAARSLEDAKRVAIAEAQEAARAALLALAQEGEEIFIHLKRFRAELVSRAAAAREVGGIEAWGQRESLDYFSDFITRANRSAAASAADSGAFMKYPNWTTCLAYICGKIQP